MQTADDFDEEDERLVTVDPGSDAARGPAAQWLINRRRIEQAHEQRELSKSLADFEDDMM